MCKDVRSSSQRSKFETKLDHNDIRMQSIAALPFPLIPCYMMVSACCQQPVLSLFTSQAELFKAFKELFVAATSRPPPYGICPYPSSRAIYAVDLMLKWSSGQNGELSS